MPTPLGNPALPPEQQSVTVAHSENAQTTPRASAPVGAMSPASAPVGAMSPASAPVGATADERRRSVLVVVLNNNEDLRRAASEGWYRIPQRRAPRRIGADYIAFYQTGAFRRSTGDGTSSDAPGGFNEVESAAQAITWYAPTRRYQLLTRRMLLPGEPTHPRADEYYYRIELGPLQRLAQPVPAASFHRVTFIHTTLDALLHAPDVVDLFRKDDPFDILWDALRAHQLRPLKNRLVADQPMDIALRARGGYVGVRCSESSAAREARPLALAERWELITFSAAHIENDLDGCLRRVGAALISLGGSVLNLP